MLLVWNWKWGYLELEDVESKQGLDVCCQIIREMLGLSFQQHTMWDGSQGFVFVYRGA